MHRVRQDERRGKSAHKDSQRDRQTEQNGQNEAGRQKQAGQIKKTLIPIHTPTCAQKKDVKLGGGLEGKRMYHSVTF